MDRVMYAFFIFKKVRHTCCLSFRVNLYKYLYIVPRWLSSTPPSLYSSSSSPNSHPDSPDISRLYSVSDVVHINIRLAIGIEKVVSLNFDSPFTVLSSVRLLGYRSAERSEITIIYIVLYR